MLQKFTNVWFILPFVRHGTFVGLGHRGGVDCRFVFCSLLVVFGMSFCVGAVDGVDPLVFVSGSGGGDGFCGVGVYICGGSPRGVGEIRVEECCLCWSEGGRGVWRCVGDLFDWYNFAFLATVWFPSGCGFGVQT